MRGQQWEVVQVYPEGQVLHASEGEGGILEEMVEGTEETEGTQGSFGGTGQAGSPVSSACHWK